tara:strand:- start:37408 stop:37644 length:237 start_codon:yes stop_codon:yes gene_type:complete
MTQNMTKKERFREYAFRILQETECLTGADLANRVRERNGPDIASQAVKSYLAADSRFDVIRESPQRFKLSDTAHEKKI